MAEEKNVIDVPPVFIGLDDLESGGIFKGPWEKKETMEMFSNLLSHNKIGVSSDPRSGAFLENNVEMALRSTPGNVEVGILHKEGHRGNQGVGWTEAGLEKFATAASLFLQSPYSHPTIHAPVDVNWSGLRFKENSIEFSEDERKKEVNWIKEQVIPKIKPFLNVLEIKKEEGLLNKDFKIPVVFHSTPALGLYRGSPLDLTKTTADILYDVKGEKEIYRGSLENLAHALGYEMPKINGEDNFEKREKVKETLIKELEKKMEDNLKKSVIDTLVEAKKLESSKALLNDLYKKTQEIKEVIKELEPSKEIDVFAKDLEEKIKDSWNLHKLEELGVSSEEIKRFLETYSFYKDNFGIMEEKDVKKYQQDIKNSLYSIKESLERAKKDILPVKEENLVTSMAEKIKDIYKRLGETKKAEEIGRMLESEKTEDLYKKFKKELEELSNKIKDKKLVEIKPIENVALEKTAESIAETALYFAKDPLIRNNAFLAIENFFPEDLFGGKIYDKGKKEWAMKALMEKSREKFKEKAIKEGFNEKEANELAEKLIGMTLDMGHFNLWRSRGIFKNEEEFLKEAKDFVKSVAPFVKHIHLTDNPGTEDTHQEIGTGNVPNELAFDILREEWKKRGEEPTITIEWGGPQGLAGTQPSNYVNWKAAVDPNYGRFRTSNYSSLYRSFSYHPTEGFYYKQQPYLTSWLK